MLVKDKIKQQSKEEYSYKKMLDYGWNPEQASGIVGNLKYESGLNTSKEGDVGYKGGSSFGLAQFRGERLKTLKKRYGNNWTDLDNQLEFVNWELNNTHKSAGDKLRQAKGVYNTGKIVSDFYEIPAKKWNQNDDRQKTVYDLHKKYSGVQLTDEDKANFLKGTAQRAIDSYKPSTVVTDLPISNENTNLASVPEQAQEEESKEVISAKEELQQKQNEENFIADLYANAQEEVPQVQPVVQPQQANILEKYAQIESFVENPVLQQGGVIADQEGQRKYPNQITEIRGNVMATDGYGNIPLYVVPDLGTPRVVYPNTGEHVFQGATKFTEYPLTNQEKAFIKAVQQYKNKK